MILSHYVHKQGNPLSAAMVRYMAVCLWTEFKWEMPPGKTRYKREKNFFINTHSGRFVVARSKFSKIVTDYSKYDPSTVGDLNEDKQPIKPPTKRVGINPYKRSPLSRAVGKELGKAVSHAMGGAWLDDYRLLDKAAKALGLPY